MTKLCPRGKAAAKRKFKVYPSAYANAYASKICAGKIKDPSGVKRKDFRGPKPSGAKTGVMVEKEEGKKQQKENVIKKIQQQRKTKQQRLEDLKKELGMKNGGVKSKNQTDPRKGLEFKKGRPPKGTSDHLGNPVVVREAKVGKLMTAGAQSGMGRLEKSGLIKAKKGKGIMIMIAVGKKKEPTKKMAGGMTSMRPRMMNKGGGADTGTIGEERSKIGVTMNKFKRQIKNMPIGTRGRKEALKKIKSAGEKAMQRGNIQRSLASAKDFQKGRRELFKSTAGKNINAFNKGGGADYMNTVKARKRGNPAVVEQNRKTLKEKNKLVGGGEVRGSGAAIRGKHFKGVF